MTEDEEPKDFGDPYAGAPLVYEQTTCLLKRLGFFKPHCTPYQDMTRKIIAYKDGSNLAWIGSGLGATLYDAVEDVVYTDLVDVNVSGAKYRTTATMKRKVREKEFKDSFFRGNLHGDQGVEQPEVDLD